MTSSMEPNNASGWREIVIAEARLAVYAETTMRMMKATMHW
jgi:hypothetical protein